MSWRWIFVLNVPIVLFSFIVAARYAGESRDPEAAPIDWAGAAVLLVALTVLVGFGQTYYFRLLSGTPTTLTAGAITPIVQLHAIAFTAWVLLEQTTDHHTVISQVGNVHGGWIMKLVDEAGALACMRHAQRRVVTVSIDQMVFRQPIRIGDLVILNAQVTYADIAGLEAEGGTGGFDGVVADPPHRYEHPAPYVVGLASRRMVDEPVIVVWAMPTREPRKGSQL